MNIIVRVFLLLIGSILGIMILLAIIKNSNNTKYIDALNKKDFFMQDFFIIGLNIMEYFGLKKGYFMDRYKNKIEFLYGDKFYMFYEKIIMSAIISYILIFLTSAFILAAVFDEIILLYLIIFLGAFSCLYIFLDIDLKYKKEVDDILSDFPKMLSKLQIFLTTGMPLRQAWKKTSVLGKSRIFEEMLKIEQYVQNGYTEIEAINKFGDNCKLNDIKKFSLLLAQNIEKGNKDVIIMINALADESWKSKKHRTMKKAEIASSKLIFPLVIMLISIMLMVVVPIFSNF